MQCIGSRIGYISYKCTNSLPDTLRNGCSPSTKVGTQFIGSISPWAVFNRDSRNIIKGEKHLGFCNNWSKFVAVVISLKGKLK